MTSQILTIRRILGVRAKKFETTHLFIDFSKAFVSKHRGKMEQILFAYDLPKEIVAAIIMLYQNTKVNVCSPDGDTDYFDIVADVLQGDALALYLFSISQDYALKTSIDLMKENGFNLGKERSRRYPAQTITDADNADDIALLANTPAQAETLLHILEWAAGDIGRHANAEKTEYVCFNQRGDISTPKVFLWNSGTSSPTSEAVFHQPRKTSTHNQQRHGQLPIDYRSYGSQTRPIK